MTEEQQKRLGELEWAEQRKDIKLRLQENLNKQIPNLTYSFLTDEISDEIMLACQGWPRGKWDDKLYLQTLINDEDPINRILVRFIQLTTTSIVYIFSMYYHFGLVAILKEDLVRHWIQLIEIDGDEILCYIPGRPEFISIEKREENIMGNENDGYQLIYEVTFSSNQFKAELETNGG